MADTPNIELPPKPLAYEYVYGWADGARKLSPSMRNGLRPDTSETVYTSAQLEAYARAAIAADRASQLASVAAPEGFVLVPREPTPMMVEAGKDERMECFKDTALSVGDALSRIYRAMLATAPEVAATPEAAERPHWFALRDTSRAGLIDAASEPHPDCPNAFVCAGRCWNRCVEVIGTTPATSGGAEPPAETGEAGRLANLKFRGLLGVIGTAQAQARRILASEGDADDLRQDRRDLPDTLATVHRAIASLAAQAAPVERGLAQIGWRDRTYSDSTPQLHVGDSAFEDWFQGQPFACQSGVKQISRDSYAAGMGDPLVTAASPQPVVQGVVAAPVAWLDVQAERRRQVSAEGWSTEHDDEHDDGSLAQAAACYALGSPHFQDVRNRTFITLWPWGKSSWKEASPRRQLVKAGALILAEIERIDRATPAPGAQAAEGRKL